MTPQSFVLVAVAVVALIYAIYKHVGMAALKAAFEKPVDPKTIVDDALAAHLAAVAASTKDTLSAVKDAVAPTVAAAAPAPAAAAPANPFIAWKAEGLSLYDAILRLTHYPDENEWPLAVAAGYVRPVPPPPEAPADTSSFIQGDTLVFEKVSGQNVRVMGPRKLTLPVPAGFSGLVRLGAGSNSDSHSVAHVSINGGQYPREVPSQSAVFTHSVRFGAQRSADEIVMPTTPMNLVYEVAEAADSGCVVQVQIYPDA